MVNQIPAAFYNLLGIVNLRFSQAQGKQVSTIEGNITAADIATTQGAEELAIVRYERSFSCSLMCSDGKFYIQP